MPSLSPAPPRRPLRLIALAAQMTLLALGGVFAAAAVEFAPGASPRLIAVYPPWWPGDRALAAAAAVAPVAGVGGFGFAIAVVADRPDAAQALRRAGALFVIDGSAFPACFSSARPSP